MDRRYDILETESVRDIESYHWNVFGKNIRGNTTKNRGSLKAEGYAGSSCLTLSLL